MPLPKIEPGKIYTYADYLTWPDDEHWELIEGIPYNISPAPLIRHQEILLEIASILHGNLKGKPCKAFVSPVDVRLKNDIHAVNKETYSVVQPDLVVVCDKNKVDEKGIVDAPDICIEILSESTSYKDEGDKYKLYEKHGVKEYWIVNPVIESISVFKHNGRCFEKPVFYKNEEILESAVLPELQIRLADVFETEEEHPQRQD